MVMKWTTTIVKMADGSMGGDEFGLLKMRVAQKGENG
jgi:hypothetical protein